MAIAATLVVSLGALAGHSATAEPGQPSPTIVGGSDADQIYPFMAVLSQGGEHYCGGVVIDPEWVITAAHCVADRDPASVTLRIGSTSRSSGGVVTTADELHAHPDFDWDDPGGDVGLVRLREPVRTEQVGLGEPAGEGTPVRLLGWGQSCPEADCGEQPDTLQQLDTEVVGSEACDDIDGAVELCLDNPGGDAGPCYGDSGGPALGNDDGQWTLVGLVSRPGYDGDACGQGPSIASEADPYSAWTDEVTGASGDTAG
ncbi:serine protease [Haloechinothrix sp. LS1_15]|uniref:S1 family peptidase n=1 Tax=Haloechinothrix sp. LS1_15 TaxID=2652248 RepID=UPI00294AEC05|nr:serine protease [Haloechinothrix sp. LS1_15]